MTLIRFLDGLDMVVSFGWWVRVRWGAGLDRPAGQMPGSTPSGAHASPVHEVLDKLGHLMALTQIWAQPYRSNAASNASQVERKMPW